MSIEPATSPRLARARRAAEAEPGDPPSPLPSIPLACDVAACPDCRARAEAVRLELCSTHEALWRFEQALAAPPARVAPEVGRVLRLVMVAR
jgi:hypothetical protein